MSSACEKCGRQSTVLLSNGKSPQLCPECLGKTFDRVTAPQAVRSDLDKLHERLVSLFRLALEHETAGQVLAAVEECMEACTRAQVKARDI